MASGKSSNRAEVPEAREALDQFKYEVAQELNIPLKRGYNAAGGESCKQDSFLHFINIYYQERQMSGRR